MAATSAGSCAFVDNITAAKLIMKFTEASYLFKFNQIPPKSLDGVSSYIKGIFPNIHPSSISS